jgi:hypothetical protein
MFVDLLERKAAVRTILNDLLAEEPVSVLNFNADWLLDLKVRDGVIWCLFDETSNVEHYSRDVWFPKVIDRLSVAAVEADSSDGESMAYAVAAALGWSNGLPFDGLLEKASSCGYSSFLGLIERAFAARIPGKVFVDSVTCLTLDKVLADVGEDSVSDINGVVYDDDVLLIESPAEAARFLWKSKGLLSDDCGLIVIQSDGTFEILHGGSLDFVNGLIENYNNDDDFYDRMVFFTLRSDVDSSVVYNSGRCLDYMFVDLDKLTFRSLICKDEFCCPADGVSFV